MNEENEKKVIIEHDLLRNLRANLTSEIVSLQSEIDRHKTRIINSHKAIAISEKQITECDAAIKTMYTIIPAYGEKTNK